MTRHFKMVTIHENACTICVHISRRAVKTMFPRPFQGDFLAPRILETQFLRNKFSIFPRGFRDSRLEGHWSTVKKVLWRHLELDGSWMDLGTTLLCLESGGGASQTQVVNPKIWFPMFWIVLNATPLQPVRVYKDNSKITPILEALNDTNNLI